MPSSMQIAVSIMLKLIASFASPLTNVKLPPHATQRLLGMEVTHFNVIWLRACFAERSNRQFLSDTFIFIFRMIQHAACAIRLLAISMLLAGQIG